jgi:hypothetical protein
VRHVTWREGEAAARIPLTEGAVLDLIWQHFAEVDAVYVAPNIPASKELAARRAHVAHLPPRERILALYEAPSAHGLQLTAVHEGFVITSERICWRNAGEPATSIVWMDLDPERVILEDQRLFVTDDEAIRVVEHEVQLACSDALHILALSSSMEARDRLPDFDDVKSGLVCRFEGDARRPAHSGITSERLAETVPPPEDWEEATVRREFRWSTTPPPPSTFSLFSYASETQELAPDCSCWHCKTPLYSTSPQCAFCSAEPTAAGWLRTTG